MQLRGGTFRSTLAGAPGLTQEARTIEER
jgi:hypothetical protein